MKQEIVNTWDQLHQGPNCNEMDVAMTVEIGSDSSSEEAVDIGTGITITEAEWSDYLSLNKALQERQKDTALRLLQSNCVVNVPSALIEPSNTPMHYAVLLGDIELVHCLLSRGASVSTVNSEGDTPLHLAFIRRQDNLVDLILSFIEKNSNYVNPINSQGLTHLHIASTRKNAHLVENFLGFGADIQDSVDGNSPVWPGYTALHFAVEFGSMQSTRVLQRALRKSKKDDNCKAVAELAREKVKNLSIMVHMLSAENHCFSNFGYFTHPSYFHFACMRSDPKAVAEFIKNGADVNTPISRDAVFCGSYSPLHFAVESKCVENVKLLLEQGAAVEHRSNDNMTPLHLAMYHENSSERKYAIVDYLYAALEDKEACLRDDYGLSYLHVACTRNDVELVQKFLDNGHNVNARIRHNPRRFSNYTALHFAVLYRSYDVVQLLIERSANVNFVDYEASGTPLHLACEVGHAGIIDLLLRNEAIPSIVRPRGNKTTLHLLVESYMERETGTSEESKSDLLPFVKRLARLGVNVNARDHLNYTALHWACWKLVDASQLVRKLLEAGADVNAENVDGQTPLEMTYFESYCGNADDYMTLYHHVQKLKLLGYKVNPKNDGFCEVVIREKDNWDSAHKDFKDKRIAKRDEQMRDEIQRLRSTRIQTPQLTLYDLLVQKTRNLTIFARDPVVQEIMERKGLKKEFPAFAHFLKHRYEKALKKLRSWSAQTNRAVGKSRQCKRQRFR